MYRIVPVSLLVAALCLHFAHCEWYYGENAKDVTADQLDRAIYYRHRSSTFRKRGDHLPRDLMLLVRSSVDTEDAKLYGVPVPVLMAGGAGLVFYFNRNAGAAGTA